MTRKIDSRINKALVTGASKGLGFAIADSLAREGVEVWGTSRSVSKGFCNGIHFVPLDLCDDSSIQDFSAVAFEENRFDLFVNNAGSAIFGAFYDFSKEDVRNQIKLLLEGPIRLTCAYVNSLPRDSFGGIVNVSSLAGEFPIPQLALYNAAKSGLSAFSQSIMLEVFDRPIFVIDMLPGDIRTDFNQSVIHRGLKTQHSVWKAMNSHGETAITADYAANKLMRALRQPANRVLVVGSFFQTIIAIFGKRVLPRKIMFSFIRRYYW
jgi:short-subunit dehydrogenase